MADVVSKAVAKSPHPLTGKPVRREVFFVDGGATARASLYGPMKDPDAGRGYEWRLTMAAEKYDDWRAWSGFVGTATQRTDKAARAACIEAIRNAADEASK